MLTGDAGDNILRGELLLVLDDAVRNLDDIPLDGEWQNPIDPDDTGGDRFPSGNERAGSDFLFRLNVLPGDADQSGTNSLNDLQLLAANWQQATTTQNKFVDFDGSNQMFLNDLQILAMNWRNSLPDGEPMPSVSATAQSSSWSSRVDLALATDFTTDKETEFDPDSLTTMVNPHRRRRGRQL